MIKIHSRFLEIGRSEYLIKFYFFNEVIFYSVIDSEIWDKAFTNILRIIHMIAVKLVISRFSLVIFYSFFSQDPNSPEISQQMVPVWMVEN